MKKFFLFIVILSIAGLSVQAQLVTSSLTKETSKKGYQSIYFQWNPSTIKSDGLDHDFIRTDEDYLREILIDDASYHFTGMTMGYSRAFNLTQDFPLFLEIGGALQYSFADNSYSAYNLDTMKIGTVSPDITFVSIKVPLKLICNWDIANNFTIAPYAGITTRFNVWGHYDVFYDITNYNKAYSGNNMFSKKGLGWKRFQIGWQIGANFKFQNFLYLGASYGTDFNSFTSDHAKIHTTSVTLGFIF